MSVKVLYCSASAGCMYRQQSAEEITLCRILVIRIK